MIKKSMDIGYPKKPRSLFYIYPAIALLVAFSISPAMAEQHWEKTSYTTQNININKNADNALAEESKNQPSKEPILMTPVVVEEEIFLPPQMETIVEVDTVEKRKVLKMPSARLSKPEPYVAPLPAPVVESKPVPMMAPPTLEPELEVDSVNEIVMSDQILLQPNDQLYLQVLDERKMTGYHVVSNDYTIDVPLIGALNVKNKTIQQAESYILRELKNGYLKSPTIKLERANAITKEFSR